MRSKNYITFDGEAKYVNNFFANKTKVIKIKIDERHTAKGKRLLLVTYVANDLSERVYSCAYSTISYHVYILLLFGLVEESSREMLFKLFKTKGSLGTKECELELKYTDMYNDFKEYSDDKKEHIKNNFHNIQNYNTNLSESFSKVIKLSVESVSDDDFWEKNFGSVGDFIKKRARGYFNYVLSVIEDYKYNEDLINGEAKMKSGKIKRMEFKDINLDTKDEISDIWEQKMKIIIEEYRATFRDLLEKEFPNRENSIVGSKFKYLDAAHIVEVKTIKRNARKLIKENDISGAELELMKIADPNNGIFLEPNIHREWDYGDLLLKDDFRFYSLLDKNHSHNFELKNKCRSKKRAAYIRERMS